MTEKLAQIEAQKADIRTRRNALSARVHALLRCATALPLAIAEGLESLRNRLRNLCRRAEPPLEDFDLIAEELAQIERVACTKSEPPVLSQPAIPGVESAVSEADRVEDASSVLPDQNDVDDGQTVRHIESEPPKEKNTARDEEHMLRKLFAQTWTRCRQVSEYHPEPPADLHEAGRILVEFGSFIGLGRDAVARAIAQLGYGGTVVMLDYFTEKLDRIGDVTAYAGMILRKHAQGEMVAGGRIAPGRLV